MSVGKIVPVGVLLVLLVACGDDADEKVGDENAVAQGEVLEGTISDDMLPLETLTSQAPRADGKADVEPGDGSDEGEDN